MNYEQLITTLISLIGVLVGSLHQFIKSPGVIDDVKKLEDQLIRYKFYELTSPHMQQLTIDDIKTFYNEDIKRIQLLETCLNKTTDIIHRSRVFIFILAIVLVTSLIIPTFSQSSLLYFFIIALVASLLTIILNNVVITQQLKISYIETKNILEIKIDTAIGRSLSR